MKANEHFRDAVISVVDEIKAQQIKSRDNENVTYLLTRDIVQHSIRFHGFEKEAIDFLKEEKVIRELERDELIIGEPGQKNYGAYQSLKLKILKSLDLFLEKFKLETDDLESGKVLFRVTTGELSYINNIGRSFAVVFKPSTIQYQVVFNVLSALGANIDFKTCVEGVTDNKAHSDTSDEEKVRGALKAIRKQLRETGLNTEEVNSIFTTNYGLSITIPFTIIP